MLWRFGLILVCGVVSGCVSGNAPLKCLKNADTGQTICVGDGVTEKDVAAAMLSGPPTAAPQQGSVTQLRDVGGIPQTVETKVTGPATVTQTYTYGTPPPKRASTAVSAPVAAQPPAATARKPCRNTMVGGDGYACMPI